MLHFRVEGMSRRLSTPDVLELEQGSLTRNYNPLPVVAAKAKGAWVRDVEGKKYLDCLAAYSAVNFGHSNPTLIRAAKRQLGRVTLTSRAFHHDQLGLFATELADLLSTDMVLPMNSGAEAVESAIKVARAWGYRVKGVQANKATIVVAKDNFHGRTISIVSFSSDESSRKDFGPFTPGFTQVDYGDIEALEKAITDIEAVDEDDDEAVAKQTRRKHGQRNIGKIAARLHCEVMCAGHLRHVEGMGLQHPREDFGRRLDFDIAQIDSFRPDRSVL